MVAASHPIILRGLDLGGEGASPTILHRIDQEFIPALLNELAQENGLQVVGRTLVQQPAGSALLKLFQPVHRVFHLALLELVCDDYGQPRFDPKYIHSAGLVVRRDSPSAQSAPEQTQGWMESAGQLRGWMDLDNESDDPDPQFRRPKVRTGHPEIDRRIQLYRRQLTLGPDAVPSAAPLAESVTTLFVAPPEVCQAIGKTVLYGLIPVASSDYSEAPPTPSFSDPDTDKSLRSHIHRFLTQQGQRSLNLSGVTLDAQDVESDSFSAAERAELDSLILLVEQVALEFDAFGDSPSSQELLGVLNEVRLPMEIDFKVPIFGAGGSLSPLVTMGAGDFLRQAGTVLLEREPGQEVTMPLVWPEIREDMAGRILASIKASLTSTMKTLISGEKRFDGAASRYHIRAFARVLRQDGCPPETVWSEPSRQFTIAPWYDSVPDGGPPPVQVALPDPTDRNALRALKPNVAFKVPEQLAHMLQRNGLGDFLDGEPKNGGSNLGLDWLCGFNIAIITICAFIVLSIFLSLFDLIFRWLMFIKICIPIPKRQ